MSAQRHLPTVRLALGLLALALAACDRDPAPSTSSAQSALVPPPIGPLPSGLPPLGKVWESVDYEAAAVALESTAPANLPTASSPAFARITASSNFDIFVDKSRPLSLRLTENAASTRALMRIMKVYLDNSAHGERFIRERLMFMVAGLHAMVVLWQTVDEATQGLDSKDPNYATRMDSLVRMRQESGRQVERLLSGLDPREDCDTVRWYAGALQMDFAMLVARTSEVDRDRTRRRIQEIVDRQSRPECKAAVAELLGAFENKP